jgi:hypothetical protein
MIGLKKIAGFAAVACLFTVGAYADQCDTQEMNCHKDCFKRYGNGATQIYLNCIDGCTYQFLQCRQNYPRGSTAEGITKNAVDDLLAPLN